MSCSLHCDLIYILFTSPPSPGGLETSIGPHFESEREPSRGWFESQFSSLSSLCIRQSESGRALHSGEGISCLWGLKNYLRGCENQGIIRNREDLTEKGEIKPGSQSFLFTFTVISQCRRHKDMSSIPGWGRSPGGGNDNPL